MITSIEASPRLLNRVNSERISQPMVCPWQIKLMAEAYGYYANIVGGRFAKAYHVLPKEKAIVPIKFGYPGLIS
jgi:hypothetical protein